MAATRFGGNVARALFSDYGPLACHGALTVLEVILVRVYPAIIPDKK
jgi:hypothetical protein